MCRRADTIRLLRKTQRQSAMAVYQEKAFSELEEQRPTKSEAQQQQRQQENATKMAEARIEEVEANMRSVRPLPRIVATQDMAVVPAW